MIVRHTSGIVFQISMAKKNGELEGGGGKTARSIVSFIHTDTKNSNPNPMHYTYTMDAEGYINGWAKKKRYLPIMSFFSMPRYLLPILFGWSIVHILIIIIVIVEYH